METLQVRSITVFKEYHGVNISITGYLEKTRVPVSIDIGFGDTVYPQRTEIDFPFILGTERPNVYAYSLVSSIAEKFQAIVSLGYDNTRFKDFYDLYLLMKTYDFSGSEVTEAVNETFKNRHTSLDHIAAFETDFTDGQIRLKRWNSFIKEKSHGTGIHAGDS